ncbi:adenylyl-sulfate kinase [Candidatus Palauibacter polyketidifaciens]|uniref:adenylyl-sulfate kinase n=1 Tax=Candidatus Palauibacter polyketidifaciens TaxID=3056740 RepID=UPI002387EDAD|nr:adenylyl-sulfate kinase [Candidatus Palauibacter polyketidifaciens]MDE2719561.1 adenylyl-sulfate kinase [Candidatus Palauibacter polyketidifaciens]
MPPPMPPPVPATLRFVLCGSVDDGKSTLIGRLLYDCRQVFSDELRRLERDSVRYGTQGTETDLALLVDGLRDEREQGITIDVAYRSFETPSRRFIVADAPGHEQYTRNMATGASTADLAVVLVDARKGVLPQTARHTRIVAMFGVRRVVLAVNKMDLVEWDRGIFESIRTSYRAIADEIGLAAVEAIPVSALTGANLTRNGASAPWYAGPTLLAHLETVDVEESPAGRPFRMPVQYVNRPHADFRGYCGRVAGGTVAVGDAVGISPAGTESRVASILVGNRTRDRAGRGDAVTLTLAPDVDVTRGDVVVDADEPVGVADQFQARLVWMHDEPLAVGRPYVMKLHSREVGAAVTRIRHRLDVSNGNQLAASVLKSNDLGTVNLATNRAVPFAPFDESRALGGFILIDRATNATAAAGTILFPLMRAANVKWQHLDVSKEVRSRLKLQRAQCVWLTGMSASGKSTIANLLDRRLTIEGRHTYLLDGDNVRHGLCRDLGFTEADRVENIRRVAEVARLMVDAGLIVIVAFISPFRSERDYARSLFEPGEFMEVHVDASLEACAERDPKGLYAKALRGEIRNFTGVDSPYERPERPDLRLDTETLSPEECVELLTDKLSRLP